MSQVNRERRQERARLRDGKRTKLPATFEPRFWLEADRRTASCREILRRVKQLKEHTGADSVQKELLCERAAFVALQLETAEVRAVEGEPFDAGSYTQAVNCLVGLLRALGLHKPVKHAGGLKAYIKSREGES